MGSFKKTLNNFGLTRHDNWYIFSTTKPPINSFNNAPITDKKYLQEPIEIASSKNTHVFRGTIKGHDTPVYLKQYLDKGSVEILKNSFRTHRGIREVASTLQLQSLGFNAPTILQFGYRKTLFSTSDHFLITEELADFVNLYQAVDLLRYNKQFSKRGLISTLAQQIGNFHLQNLSHGDLRPGNIMISFTNTTIQVAFLDNERTKKHYSLPERLRVKNLVQLNMIISDQISVCDRLRFFILYCREAQIQNRHDLLQKIIGKTRKRLSRLVRLGRLKQEEVFL